MSSAVGWELGGGEEGRGGGGGAGQGQSYFERGRRPHHLAIVQDQSSSDGIILVVDEELLLVAREGTHGQQELGQVVAVQRAGLCWQPTWQICVPHTYHSLQCAPANENLKKDQQHLLAIWSDSCWLMTLPTQGRGLLKQIHAGQKER